MNCEQVNPYDNDTRQKGEQVRAMFNNIAPAYDFMNRAMTLGVDKSWRKHTVKTVAATNPSTILDVATGTGDLAIALAEASPEAKITGVDLSEGMLDIGRQKVASKGLENRVELRSANCLNLPFADDSFDAVTVAFGVRNFENLARGYDEMFRVIKPGGMICVLELSTPVNPIVKPFYKFYTRGVIPTVGRIVAGDSRAYTYLPESIAAVAQGDEMLELMRASGFEACRYRRFTFGVCTFYMARKPK